MKRKEFKITLSYGKRIPCLWERGGGATNTGYAMIIADMSGGKKKALYIRQRGELAGREHALIPISVGDYIIEASHHRKDFHLTVWKIVSVSIEEEKAEATKICEFDMNEWDIEPPNYLLMAIEKAKEKALCYHCRSAHYVLSPSSQ